MIDKADLEQLILDHVTKTNYQPVKPRVIAKKLKLSDDQYHEFKKSLKRLVKNGQVAWGSNHLVQLAEKKKTDSRQIVGVFRRTSGGFGFVHPSSSVTRTRDDDIFIPPRKMLDAADGDLVSVRLDPRKQDDGSKQRGEVVEVIERETHQFVGSYLERAGEGFVQIDGTLFAQPIFVGDAGAKNARTGDKVVMEMVRFPSHLQDGEGVIVEVLGGRGQAGVDTLTVMREFRLPEQFPEDVLQCARDEAERFSETVQGHRRDFTETTVITIDPVDARDFDDAVSLEQLGNGHWRLGVHIADVSHFVRPNTALDDEARKRATSVYLPDKVIPMLPETISNNLASLQPGRVRFTRTAIIEFTADGARVAAEVCSGAIKSDRRFTYEEVDEYLADPKPWKSQLTPEVFALLGRMHELAMILRRRRMEGGSIELTLPEVKIDLDDDGRVCGAHVAENTVSHQIIEEFMLAANEAVAQTLLDKELIFLRRIHGPPTPKKLKDLTSFVREMGIPCESLESRFEIKRVIEEVADRPERHAINYAVLRSMQKAVYSPVDEGHYALASPAYCHFTSPIRRYPDLAIHRMFDALAEGKRPPQDYDQIMLLGEHCSEREQRAEKAERELIKVKMLNFLHQKIGDQMEAIVTGVEDYGLFVQGVDLPAEGLIHVTSMQDDYYVFDKPSHSLTGRREGNSFRLGDVVCVEIARVDVDRRELDFRLVKATKTRKPAKSAKKSPAKKKAAKRPSTGQRKKRRR